MVCEQKAGYTSAARQIPSAGFMSLQPLRQASVWVLPSASRKVEVSPGGDSSHPDRVDEDK